MIYYESKSKMINIRQFYTILLPYSVYSRLPQKQIKGTINPTRITELRTEIFEGVSKMKLMKDFHKEGYYIVTFSIKSSTFWIRKWRVLHD